MSNIPEQEERDGKILLEICVGTTCYVLGGTTSFSEMVKVSFDE